MDTVLAVSFWVLLLALVVSAFTVLVGVLGMSRGWRAASRLTGDRLLHRATVWIAFGLVVSSLGTLAGAVGLLFGALWCALLLLTAASEMRASTAGNGSPRWRTVLIVALGAQAASALVLAVMLMVEFSTMFASKTAANSGPTGLYTLLFAQYGIVLAAVALSSMVAMRRLSRLSGSAAERGGAGDLSGVPDIKFEVQRRL